MAAPDTAGWVFFLLAGLLCVGLAVGGVVLAAVLARRGGGQSEIRWLRQENEELRRENERLRRVLEDREPRDAPGQATDREAVRRMRDGAGGEER